MSKERELLERALAGIDNIRIFEEIRAFLAAEKEAEPEPVGSICLRDETGLFYYAPVYLHPPKPAEPTAMEPISDELIMAVTKAKGFHRIETWAFSRGIRYAERYHFGDSNDPL